MYNFFTTKQQTVDFLSHNIASKGDGYYILKLEDSDNHFTWVTMRQDSYNEQYYNGSVFKTLYAGDFYFIDQGYNITKVGNFNNGLADAEVEEISYRKYQYPVKPTKLQAVVSRTGFVKTDFSKDLSINAFKQLAKQIFCSPNKLEEIITNANIDNIKDIRILTDVALHALELTKYDLKIKEDHAKINKDKLEEYLTLKNSISKFIDYTYESIEIAYKNLCNKTRKPKQKEKTENKIDPKVVEQLSQNIEAEPGNCDG